MGKKKKVPIDIKKEEPAETPEEEIPETVEELIAEVVEDEPTELEKAQQEVLELKDKNIRMQADTDNLRKRLHKDKQDSVQFANEKLIKQLIPIVDNLERALAAPDTSIENLKEGVQMTADQIMALFKKENVEPIPAVGEAFDPSVHEVLTQIESNDHDENTVIEEYAKGYRMNGRVLIPAKVVTSKKPANNKADSGNASTSAETPA